MMVKILFFLTSALYLSSCLTLNNGGKKTIFLVDAPEKITIKSKGKIIEIESLTAFTETSGSGSFKTTTRFNYPGCALRIRRNNNIQLLTNDKIVTVGIKGNPTMGIVLLILEIPFTLGIGTVVDIAVTSYYYPKTKFIDVKAYLEGTKPRSQKDLRNYIHTQPYTKIYKTKY